ncbi:MAG TPA: sugar ABC transporter permease [Dehalococcoidia bacterium]
MVGRRWWVPWLWLSPALLLAGVFLVYPTLDTLRRSFMDARATRYVGFDNYRYIIDNPDPLLGDTHSALLNTLLWLIAYPLGVVVLGLLIAVLAARVRYESLAKSAVFVPMAISFVAASVIWRFMFDFNPDVGTVNAVVTELGGYGTAWLQNTGSPWLWLTTSGPASLPAPLQLNNFSLVMVAVWMWTGFAVVVLSAGLKGIPRELLEAARVDGAGEWQVLRHVTLPMMLPTIAVVATTMVIQALKLFDLVWVMTGGAFQTDVIASLFFRESFLLGNFGVGSALAVVLLLWVVPVVAFSLRRFRMDEGR